MKGEEVRTMENQKRTVTLDGCQYALTLQRTGTKTWRATGAVRDDSVQGMAGHSIEQAISNWGNKARMKLDTPET